MGSDDEWHGDQFSGEEEFIDDFSVRDKLWIARKAFRFRKFRWCWYYLWTSIPVAPAWLIWIWGIDLLIFLPINLLQAFYL